MKIIYFSQFYPPESIAGAFRAYDHAKAWANAGEDVTVFTGWPNYPTGKIFGGYEAELLAEEYNENIRVLRSKIVAKPNTNFFRRIINGMSFLMFGCVNTLFNRKKIGKDFKVALVSVGPIFTGYLGLFYSKINHVPLIVEFRDIAFEQMVATGTPQNSWKVKVMKFLELHLAQVSNHVVVLTNGFKDLLIDNSIDHNKISVIPNGANVVHCQRTASSSFVFGYFGTMGISQDIPTTFKVLSAVKDSLPHMRYLLIGEGALRAEAQQSVSSGQYSFATLMHGMAQKDLESHYSEIDMSVVSLRNDPSFKATIPSKIFQSIARGVPVLFIGPDGEAARLVRENEIGIALCSDEKQNEAALKEFFSQEDYKKQLQDMRHNALVLARDQYGRQKLALQMLDIVKDVALKEMEN